jgi:hypothetical protein
MTRVFQSIATAWGRLFVRRSDNFKALLMADLGIKH